MVTHNAGAGPSISATALSPHFISYHPAGSRASSRPLLSQACPYRLWSAREISVQPLKVRSLIDSSETALQNTSGVPRQRRAPQQHTAAYIHKPLSPQFFSPESKPSPFSKFSHPSRIFPKHFQTTSCTMCIPRISGSQPGFGFQRCCCDIFIKSFYL